MMTTFRYILPNMELINKTYRSSFTLNGYVEYDSSIDFKAYCAITNIFNTCILLKKVLLITYIESLMTINPKFL